MISWLFTNWATQLAAVVFAVWFLRGMWIAVIGNPRLRYISHSRIESKKGDFLTVSRQQLIPPWLRVQEVWWVPDNRNAYHCVREGDGFRAHGSGSLELGLHSLVMLADMRQAETDELLKTDGKAE